MKVIFVSALFASLVAYTNGINVNEAKKINGQLQLLSFNNPNIKAAINISYGDVEDEVNSKLNPSSSSSSTLTAEEKACSSEISKYSICIQVEFSEKNCKEYLEDKCKDFFNDPLSVAPSCKNLDPSLRDYFEHSYKYLGQFFKLGCTNNGYCPIMEDIALFLNGSYGNKYSWKSSETEKKGYIPSESAINENCKSAECTDAAIGAFEELVNTNEASKKIINEQVEKNQLDKSEDAQVIEEYLKTMDEQTTALKSSIESLKSCKSTSTGHFISKTLTDLCVDSLLIATFFILYMRN